MPAPDGQKIAKLIKDLDGRFVRREKAMKELRRLGVLAAPALRKAHKGKPTLEARKRMDELLRALEGPVTDPETLPQCAGGGAGASRHQECETTAADAGKGGGRHPADTGM